MGTRHLSARTEAPVPRSGGAQRGALSGARALVPAVAAGLSPRMRAGRRRLGALALLAVAAATAAVFGRDLSPEVVTQWSDRAGWWFPAAFVVVSGLICVAPVPRTAFTVAAGVLFPPVPGVVLAITGSALAALLTFLAGRALGREAVERRLSHPAVRSVDERLRRRGWLAVGSLRLIPVVPFSVLSYCCSVSGVRLLPYLLATIIGSLPGTIAVVCFSDALTSGPGWVSMTTSAMAITLGLAGLIVDARLDRWRGRDPATADALPAGAQTTGASAASGAPGRQPSSF